MNSFYGPFGALELILKDILFVIKPLEEDKQARVRIINEFRAIVESVESLRGATVEPFGSFVSNLYTRWGDLDISIEIPSGSFVSSVGRRRKQNLLRNTMRALRSRGGARSIEFIPNARVPLLKFESIHQNVCCDISISNLVGQVKSKFFLWITELDERFRDMVLLVKEWAKMQNINDPKTGTLNSYSLSLLVIFHFQTCEPAILPPLQEIYEGNIVNDLTGVRFIAERNIEETCAANIARFRGNNLRNVNRSSLSELFISFFQKFSRINIMASEHAVCTYTGQWEPLSSKVEWTTKAYPLLIEDPFEQPDNAARAVSRLQFSRIFEAFAGTHEKLSANPDRNSLIASFVRPQIRSQIFARSPQGHRNARGGGFGHHLQYSTVRSPIQNQFQNMRLENNPSPSVVFTQRLRPTARAQGQQSRRPGNSNG